MTLSAMERKERAEQLIARFDELKDIRLEMTEPDEPLLKFSAVSQVAMAIDTYFREPRRIESARDYVGRHGS